MPYPFLGDLLVWICSGGVLVLIGRETGWLAAARRQEPVVR